MSLTIAGCGTRSSSTGGSGGSNGDLVISPSSVTLQAGADQIFSANMPVNWSASCGIIHNDGTYTAPNTPGTCTVTATAANGSGKRASATVTITAPPPPPSVSVTPSSVTLRVGGTQQFTANVLVTWSASCGTITSGGMYTAPNSPGACTVTATATQGGKTGTAAVTVVLPPVIITPQSVTLAIGATQQFTANVPVSWSADCGTITGTGLYTAPNVAATCTITGTALSDGGNQGKATAKINGPPPPAVSYLTWKNDNMRTGQQRNETVLTPANVNAGQFGVKFIAAVDGAIYAQPLYAANLAIAGGTHNTVFVATQHDSVYAFDAGSGAQLWSVSLIPAGGSTVPQADVGSTVYPEVGITGTPVIDASSGTLYVVAETKEAGPSYVFRLHALDIHTGAEKTGSPVVVSAQGFVPIHLMQRPGLLLANGNVYFALGSQGDGQPGWVFAYDAASLGQVAAWIDTPTGQAGGIWMAGSGIAADGGGNIYVSTGNGDWDGVRNFSMSFVKLTPTLQVLDFFTPYNWQSLSTFDKDLASGGVLLVPDQSGIYPHELIGCGKPAPVYVVNRDNMGHMNPTGDTQIIQALPDIVGGGSDTQSHCFTTPAFWEQNLYFVGVNDVIKAFHLDAATGKMTATPTSQGTFTYIYPGAQPVVSSNAATNGIVWAVDHGNPTLLHAYDAANVSHELYVSPSLGNGTKWSVPTVVNGNVYVGTGNQLIAFGLN